MPWLNRKRALIIAITSLCLLLAWWPISYNEPTTYGIDAFEYHAPVFGNHTQSQVIAVAQALESVGALIVPLHRSNAAPPVHVAFTDAATSELLHSQTIPGHAFVDDAFTYLHLDPPLAHSQPIKVTFSAPEATAQTALGIRFHPDDVYAGGSREFDAKTAPGDLALALQQRWPAWQVLIKVMRHNPQQTSLTIQALIISLVLALTATQVGWAKLPPRRKRQIELTILALLAAATIGSRIPALQFMGGVSGGDPYNYLFITDSIAHGENPFATKRLPGYPLLLLPAYLTNLDDILWMRLINVVSAGAAVFLSGLLARRLRLPWSVQIFAATLLAWQKDFFLVSLRPEPYTLYAALLLASLVLFFSLTTRRRQVLFGLVLGYAAMTRQEGFVLALVLGVAAAAYTIYTTYHNRTTGYQVSKKYIIAFAPALLLVLPFFINNAVTYGNPIYTPYFEGERLNIIDSWTAGSDAAGATWGILGSIWKTSWDQLERVPLEDNMVALGAFAAIAWWLYHTHRLPTQNNLESATTLVICLLACLAALFLFSHGVSRFVGPFLLLAAGMLVISPFALIGRAGWSGVLIVITALTQILIATWFHPFPKHYQQDFALISLALAALLISTCLPTYPRRIRAVCAATYFAFAFVFALPILPLYENGRFHAMIDRHNHTTAFDSVVYRAIQTATNLPGPYGVDEAYLPVRLYLADQAFYYNASEPSTPAEVETWLNNNRANTLVVTNNQSFMPPPTNWHLVKQFKSEGDDERLFESWVYTRP